VSSKFSSSKEVRGLDDDDAFSYRSTGDLSGDEGYTPLILACKDGAVDRVQAMINSGADVNSRTSEGRTALWYAAKGNHVNVVTALLNAWADVKTLDREGNSAADVTMSTPIRRAIEERRRLKSLHPSSENRRLAFLMSSHPRLADPAGFAKKQAAEKQAAELVAQQQQRMEQPGLTADSSSQPATSGESKQSDQNSSFSAPQAAMNPAAIVASEGKRAGVSVPGGVSSAEIQAASNAYVAPASTLMTLEPKEDRLRILQHIFQYMGRYG
jgi:hypothetical protein